MHPIIFMVLQLLHRYWACEQWSLYILSGNYSSLVHLVVWILENYHFHVLPFCWCKLMKHNINIKIWVPGNVIRMDEKLQDNDMITTNKRMLSWSSWQYYQCIANTHEQSVMLQGCVLVQLLSTFRLMCACWEMSLFWGTVLGGMIWYLLTAICGRTICNISKHTNSFM